VPLPHECGVPGELDAALRWRCSWKSNLVSALLAGYSFSMSTVSEIQAALPRLTTEELRALDVALREQLRTRKIGILYDDACGLWTEEDQASAAAEAFALMDQEEKRHEPS